MSTKGTLVTWMTTLAALLMATPFVSAEDISYSVLLQRLESLEAQLAQQDAQFASYNLGGGGVQKDDSCGSCQKGKGDCGCNAPAWFARYELTVLRPFISDANTGPGFGNEYGTGHRFILGYDGGQGMGARVRYWTYNHGHDVLPPLGPGSLHIDMDVVDLEATLHSQMDCWNLLLAGGLRYGRAGFSDGGPNEVYFEGTGPTVALEAQRRVGSRGLYLIGNARSSVLIGQIAFPDPAVDDFDDETTFVLENQLGVGWTRAMRRADLDLRLLWETQFWMNDSFADDINGFGSNLTFSGLTFSAGLRY